MANPLLTNPRSQANLDTTGTSCTRWRTDRPSPSIDQAINAGYPWLEIKCSRCKTPRAVDLAGLRHVPTTRVHDLAGRLRCVKCSKAGKRPAAELLQLWQRCPIRDES